MSNQPTVPSAGGGALSAISATEGAKPVGRWWIFPVIIVGLLFTQIVLSLVGVYLAVSSRSAAVELDYYNRALHWDDYEKQVRAGEALGWRVVWAIHPPGDANAAVQGVRRVELTLSDRDGRPLRGVQLDGTYFHHAAALEGREIHLAEDSGRPGVYFADAPLRRVGTWEFRLKARRGPDELLIDQIESVDN
jgi:nitrogen fixation protein FixH